MKHATPAALDRLDFLLDGLRKIGAFKEKSRGVFYRDGRAFLHFHEPGDALFAMCASKMTSSAIPSQAEASKELC